MERKNRYCWEMILFWFFSVCSSANSQELVPNGNFDYSDTCLSGTLANNFMAEPWIKWSSSPDFYHACKADAYSVPNGWGGGEMPWLGEGYVGMSVYVTTFTGREFVMAELLQPMSQGISYHVEFHVSMMDSAWYATRNIGALFTEHEPPVNLNSLLALESQVKYEGVDFLTGKTGWTKVEGSFIASGGERYLTIGNFDSDQETDTLFVPGGGEPPPHSAVFWSQAHYYIDGVSVIPDSIYLSTNDVELQEDPSTALRAGLVVYPNPATDVLNFSIQPPAGRSLEVTVVDFSGREILTTPSPSLQGGEPMQLDVSGWPAGIYLLSVRYENGNVLNKRVVKE